MNPVSQPLSTLKSVNPDLQSCHLEQLSPVMSFKGIGLNLYLENVTIIADDIMVIGYKEDE